MNQYQNYRNNKRPSSCQMPCSVPYSMSTNRTASHVLDNVDSLPLAMAYVPFQTFSATFSTCEALKMGTIFPELCKPFCGKRGCMR